MIRAAALVALLAASACSKAPDAAATATQRDIDAGVKKAVDDTDAARRDASVAARPVVASEQTPK